MRSTLFRTVLLVGAAALPALPAAAADTTDQPERDYLPTDIVVTGHLDEYGEDDGSSATKTPTPLVDVPQTITMITEDQLDDQGITQLNEALRYVPGVSLGTGEGHRDQLIVRGQPSTADFYLDGLRDDAEYYRATYNVARIEVLKGANALIFGRGGGGGVVNRVSKTAEFSAPALGFDASVDSFGAFALAADLNQPFSDMLAGRVNATYEEFANHRDVYEGRFIGISPTLTAQLGDATSVTAHYTYDDDDRVTDRGVPTLNGGPLTGFEKTFFGDPDLNRATNVAHVARLRLDHDFGGGLSANVTGQFADYNKYYGNVVPSGATATTVTLSGYTSATDRRNWIGQANLVWDTDLGGIGSTLLAGIEAGHQTTRAERYNILFADGSTSVTVPLARVLTIPSAQQSTISRASRSSLDSLSAYVQEQLDFGPVQLIAGLRYEEFDLTSLNAVSGFAAARTDSKVSPRGGIVFKPREELSLYVSYATSFLPQSGDQFSVLDTTTASLEPEKFENLEAGVKWAIRPTLFATAAVFRLDRSNSRAADPLNPGLTVLTGESRVEGAEFGLVGKILPGWQANLGYTWLDGEIRSDTTAAPVGRRLQQLPEHQVALWNRVDLSERFGLGAGVVYQSEQFASISNAVTLPDYWRIDAAAYWNLSPRASLQLNIENLLDESYYASAHGDNNVQPGEPFSARIGVRLTL